MGVKRAKTIISPVEFVCRVLHDFTRRIRFKHDDPEAAIESLNDDLLAEILVRLPPKLLFRSKCVSKRWLSLISAPYLRHRHILRRPSAQVATGIFLVPRNVKEEVTNCKFVLDNNGKIIGSSPLICPGISCFKLILHSCNGLLLLLLWDPNCVSVYNPTTKSIKFLPRIATVTGLHFDDALEPVNVSLAFDPDPSRGQSPSYKVIVLWRRRIITETATSNTSNYQVIVYSSETPELGWRLCQSSFVAPSDLKIFHGIYFGGAMHWIDYNRTKLFLCFDLKDECLRSNMPPLPEPNIHYYAASACGYLNLVGCSTRFDVSVFRLEKDYSKWVLMHTITDVRTTGLVDAQAIRFNCSILHLFQHEDDDDDGNIRGDNMSLVLEIDRNRVVVFRLKDHSFYPIPHSETLWNSRAYEYIESLAYV